MPALNRFLRTISTYLDADQVDFVEEAYHFADEAHDAQTRTSGERYITHPLAVADILASMRMDHYSLAAAMLHDVIEDTPRLKEELVDKFGQTVADIVDGVSKFTHLEDISREEKQALNFEKMAIAMTKDIRVIIVKLADRLHNMRTLGPLKLEKRRRVAEETFDIYARIAGRLGMQDIRVEFEERGFEAIFPLRAKRLKAALEKRRLDQKEPIAHTLTALENQIERWDINAIVFGREKHLYSIFQKMQLRGEKKRPFNDITDVFGFRIIAANIEDCYRCLGAVHTLYKPMPGKVKDYIAIPKTNGYQSLHTVVNGANNIPIEVQIRTKEMDEVANEGIAAHWLYKSLGDVNVTHEHANRWLTNLLEIQQHAGSAMDFIEHVRNDLYADEMYVFTPKGKIITLPKGATPVDFAYAVHTEIGDTCYACRVDNRTASLNHPLISGQKVHIITAKDRRPQPVWLTTVKSSRARIAIRHALKHHQREDGIELGRRMLNRTLSQIELSLDDDLIHLPSVLAEFHYASQDELLLDIGLGKQINTAIAKRLVPEKADELATMLQSPLSVDTADGTMITLSRCCRPIPGDDIVGIMSKENGLAVHVLKCTQITIESSYLHKVSPVEWAKEVSGEFPVDLLIHVEADKSLFAKIASRISESGGIIEKFGYEEKDAIHHVIRIRVAVEDRIHLANIMRRLRTIRQVEKIGRCKS